MELSGTQEGPARWGWIQASSALSKPQLLWPVAANPFPAAAVFRPDLNNMVVPEASAAFLPTSPHATPPSAEVTHLPLNPAASHGRA